MKKKNKTFKTFAKHLFTKSKNESQTTIPTKSKKTLNRQINSVLLILKLITKGQSSLFISTNDFFFEELKN